MLLFSPGYRKFLVNIRKKVVLFPVEELGSNTKRERKQKKGGKTKGREQRAACPTDQIVCLDRN
jgi:hypothetical protein